MDRCERIAKRENMTVYSEEATWDCQEGGIRMAMSGLKICCFGEETSHIVPSFYVLNYCMKVPDLHARSGGMPKSNRVTVCSRPSITCTPFKYFLPLRHQ